MGDSFWYVLFGKMWKNRLFFQAAMAGLGKYHTGSYGIWAIGLSRRGSGYLLGGLGDTT